MSDETDTSPGQWHASRERASEIVRLTDRFGEWYRIWHERGLYWAERDGDMLSGDSAGALTMIICDHLALVKERAREARLASVRAAQET
jgi:hypothetical protein